MDQQIYQEQTTLFKALNHPVRLAILDVLRLDEACVCHLEAVLGQRQAYISQQLAVLREAGLIEDRRDGWNIFYRIKDRRLYDLLEGARTLLGLPPAADEAHLVPVECPCPKCTQKRESKPYSKA